MFHLQARSSSRFETNGKGHENHFHSYFKWWIFLSNLHYHPKLSIYKCLIFLDFIFLEIKFNVSWIILEFIFLDKLTIMNNLHKGVLKKGTWKCELYFIFPRNTLNKMSFFIFCLIHLKSNILWKLVVFISFEIHF